MLLQNKEHAFDAGLFLEKVLPHQGEWKRRWHRWADASMALGSDYIFILNSRNHKMGRASKPRFYRGIHGSQQVVKGNGPLFQLILQVVLLQLTVKSPQAWQTGSAGSALSDSLNKLKSHYLITSLFYLILLYTLWKTHKRQKRQSQSEEGTSADHIHTSDERFIAQI